MIGPHIIKDGGSQPPHSNKSNKKGNCFGYTWKLISEATSRCFIRIAELAKKGFQLFHPKPASEPKEERNQEILVEIEKKGPRVKVLGDSPKDVVLRPVSQKNEDFSPKLRHPVLETVVLRPVSPKPKREIPQTNSRDFNPVQKKESIDISEIRKELGSLYCGIAMIGVRPQEKLASLHALKVRVAHLKTKVADVKENELIVKELQQLDKFLETKKTFCPIHIDSAQNKVLEPALKEIKSTELTFMQGLNEMMLYKSFFDQNSDEEISRITQLNLNQKQIKAIRDYLQLIQECHQVNTRYYDQIKHASAEYIEGMVKNFLKHDFQSVFERIGNGYQILLKNLDKGTLIKLFKKIQSMDSALPKRGDYEMLLILPIQRAPRYALLFKELLSRAEFAGLAPQQLGLIRIAANQASNVCCLMNQYR